MVGAGQDETPGRGIPVDGSLQVRKKFRNALNFVEDDRARMPGEKAFGILLGEGSGLGILERNIFIVGKDGFG